MYIKIKLYVYSYYLIDINNNKTLFAIIDIIYDKLYTPSS